MRKWGIVISVFYALLLLGLIVPSAGFLSPISIRTGQISSTICGKYRPMGSSGFLLEPSSKGPP